MRRADATLTKIPTRNKEATLTRLRNGICSLNTIRAGKRVQRTSVAVFIMPAIERNKPVLRHLCGYVGLGSQNALSGLQKLAQYKKRGTIARTDTGCKKRQ